MRTSLNKTKAIEDYLLGNMATGDALLFEANMLLNADLTDDIKHQQSTYAIIKEYGRRNIKAEIIAVREMMATAPQHRDFMQRVINLFKKH